MFKLLSDLLRLALVSTSQGLLKETRHATPFLWENELEADLVDKNYGT